MCDKSSNTNNSNQHSGGTSKQAKNASWLELVPAVMKRVVDRLSWQEAVGLNKSSSEWSALRCVYVSNVYCKICRQIEFAQVAGWLA